MSIPPKEQAIDLEGRGIGRLHVPLVGITEARKETPANLVALKNRLEQRADHFRSVHPPLGRAFATWLYGAAVERCGNLKTRGSRLNETTKVMRCRSESLIR